jgi:competence ComEA-like helix-hairpin-helix protein
MGHSTRGSRAHPSSSRHGRNALVWLVSAFGAVAVARYEAHTHPPAAAPVVAPGPPVAGARSGQAEALRDGGQIDINLATAAELELLPGVGPSLARRLVLARAQHGRFQAPSDLLSVKGVGPKTLNKLMPFLKFDSKHLEHTTESDLRLGERREVPALPQDPGTHVDSEGHGTVHQEVGAQQQVARGPQTEP